MDRIQGTERVEISVTPPIQEKEEAKAFWLREKKSRADVNYALLQKKTRGRSYRKIYF